MLKKILRYFHTIRHLKFKQIAYRLYYKFSPPVMPSCQKMPLNETHDEWQSLTTLPQQLLDNAQTLTLLNDEHDITSKNIWNDTSLPKLWLYHLHYFDFINNELISRWINENKNIKANGWEAYPTSRRIVNWIKWHLSGNELSPEAINSLVEQTTFLKKRLEWHILGNHLIANIKALIFAGCFFDSKEENKWLRDGIQLLSQQLNQQVLTDGGHFELSPMYHVQVLTDLLDCIYVLRLYKKAVPEIFYTFASSMLQWLTAMIHRDGEIAFFNDAAFKMALAPKVIFEYAQQLQISFDQQIDAPLTDLKQSGYVRAQNEVATLIIDAAEVGPAYQPGHAHADSLSFELSLGNQRVLVNAGTSCYGMGAKRGQQRGTSAHNTLVIDDKNSSDVWSGFRVGVRAHILGREVRAESDSSMVIAMHDGYRNCYNNLLHLRQWLFDKKSLEINDTVSGVGLHKIALYYHFHPDISLMPLNKNEWQILDRNKEVMATIACDSNLAWELQASHYFPEFGLQQENVTLCGINTTKLPITLSTKVVWI